MAMQADEIAVKIGLANGRHGLAGVVAWPSRQCAEMGRTPPFRHQSPPAPGETGSYWMDPKTAQLFIAARERVTGHASRHPSAELNPLAVRLKAEDCAICRPGSRRSPNIR